MTRLLAPYLAGGTLLVAMMLLLATWRSSSEEARREARTWRERAYSETAKLARGRQSQKALAAQYEALQHEIDSLQQANTSASHAAAEALQALTRQRQNVSNQLSAWRQSNRLSQQRLKKVRGEASELRTRLDVFKRSSDVELKAVRATIATLERDLARSRAARASMTTRLAALRRRQREQLAEIEALMSADGAGAASISDGGGGDASLAPPPYSGDGDGIPLVGAEMLLTGLNGLNHGSFNNNPQARPRYFTLVTVPRDFLPAWCGARLSRSGKGVPGGVASSGARRFCQQSNRTFSPRWITPEGLHMLFARTGRFLDQYRTALVPHCALRTEPSAAGGRPTKRRREHG